MSATTTARTASPEPATSFGVAFKRRRQRWAWLAIVPMTLLTVTSVHAASDAQPDPRVWLQRIGKAASSVNYEGTMVFSAGGSVSTTRVARYGVGQHSYEQTESLDGPPRRSYRHNQMVHTFWPSKKVAIVEQRDASVPFPALPAAEGGTLSAYQLTLEGQGRVAALNARVLLLTPRDTQRFAQRLWAHEETGLMLRADVLSPDGHVLESSAFTDIRFGVKSQSDAVMQAMARLDGYRVVRAAITRTRLEDEGWKMTVPVSGFEQISCVKRPVDGGEPGPQSPSIVQAIYSDGLVHISVFIEPHRAERHRPMMSSWGATHTMTQQRDDHWVTLMGDVPIDTLKKFASALEKSK